MITVKQQLQAAVLSIITQLNGDNTEKELNIMIAQEIVEEKIVRARIVENTLLGCKTDTYIKEKDIEKIEPNGAWVYKEDSLEDWTFKRHETIADAVREAIQMINSQVICNGETIVFDTLNEKEAYYLDNKENKAKIVEL